MSNNFDQKDDAHRALNALQYLPAATGRDQWFKRLSAAKDAGVSENDAREWSATGENFSASSFKDTWKSIKHGGGISAGTLFYEARQAGWKDDAPMPSAAELQRRQEAAKAAAEAAKAEEARKNAEAALKAVEQWEKAAPALANHPYLKKKSIKPHGARIGSWPGLGDNVLLLPIRHGGAGAIKTLQGISPSGEKRLLPGGKKAGHNIALQPTHPQDGRQVFVLTEGFATAASVHESTGFKFKVLACIDAGNVGCIAKLVRENKENAAIVIAGDDDWKTAGNPGREAAEKAAAEVGGVVVLPEFGGERQDGWTDFNDMHAAHGLDAVRELIEGAVEKALAEVAAEVEVHALQGDADEAAQVATSPPQDAVEAEAPTASLASLERPPAESEPVVEPVTTPAPTLHRIVSALAAIKPSVFKAGSPPRVAACVKNALGENGQRAWAWWVQNAGSALVEPAAALKIWEAAPAHDPELVADKIFSMAGDGWKDPGDAEMPEELAGKVDAAAAWLQAVSAGVEMAINAEVDAPKPAKAYADAPQQARPRKLTQGEVLAGLLVASTREELDDLINAAGSSMDKGDISFYVNGLIQYYNDFNPNGVTLKSSDARTKVTAAIKASKSAAAAIRHAKKMDARLESDFKDIDLDLLTDQRMAEAVAARHSVAANGDDRNSLKIRYANGVWYFFDGVRFNVADASMQVTLSVSNVLRRVSEFVRREDGDDSACRELESTKKCEAVKKALMVTKGIPAREEEFNTNPHLLNTPEGVIDIRTGETRPCCPREMLTQVTGVPIGKGDCPRWKAFLLRAMDGDEAMVDYIQKVFGYLIGGTAELRAVFFLSGSGGNGKGVFMYVLSKIMGSYYRTTDESTFTLDRWGSKKHTQNLFVLRDARVAGVTETNAGSQWDGERIKKISGGDTLVARSMGGHDTEIPPGMKILVSGNHQPSFDVVDPAIRDRIHVIPFNVKFSGKSGDNPYLKEELIELEGPEILAWAIEGRIKLEEDGHLNRPAVAQLATDEYLDCSDMIQLWLNEKCDVGDGYSDLSTRAFESYKRFAENMGKKDVNLPGFSYALANNYGHLKISRRLHGPKRLSFFFGFRLRERSR